MKWGPFVLGSIEDRDLVEHTIDRYHIDAAIHLAAFAYVGESMVNPRKYFANNVTNSLSLLEGLLNRNVNVLIFSSSCATYGDPLSLPMDEDHPQVPVNPYGESKLILERILKWYEGACGLKFAALRYFNACGADPDGEIGEVHTPETHVVPLILEAALDHARPFRIFGTDYSTDDGTCVRDFIHVTDLAQGHVAALEYIAEKRCSNAFNLGTGSGHSVRQLISAAEKAIGHRVAWNEAERRAGDPGTLVAAPAKARSVLGWYPGFSDLPTILRTAWNWRTSASLLTLGKHQSTVETAEYASKLQA